MNCFKIPLRKSLTLWCGLIMFLTACTGSSSSGKWEERAPGVWSLQAGRPESFNLLNSVQAEPRWEALGRRSGQEFPLDLAEIEIEVRDGKTYLRFPLEREEQIYGLGLQFKSVAQRGRIMRLHMDHAGRDDNGRTHAPVPFFVSTKGYGVLINTARYVDVWVGTGVTVDSKDPAPAQDRNTDPSWNPQPYSDNLELLVPAEGVELVMFAGEDMLDVVSRFNLWCGSGFIPPKWGLGFWHRTPTLFTSDNVREEVAAFAERAFPLDVIGLEPGWHSKAYPCTWAWDQTRFPDLEDFMADMRAKNIQVNLWGNPYIAPGEKLYDDLLPYSGTHTVWNGIVPDYTMEQPREIFKAHLKEHELDKGVSGFKIDEVDGYDVWLWPDVAKFPSGVSAEQMRSSYGNLMMDLMDEAYREENRRSYGLIRAANAGSVRFPYVIYSDNYSHRDFITGIVTASFNGVLWTPEVRASKTGEEWVRRMQTTCFSPLAMINAWAHGTKPWSFEQQYEACRDVAMLRMQLLPYIYSTFAEYYLNGTPPFRAMNLAAGFDGKVRREQVAFDDTDNPYAMETVSEVKDQYMMGGDILVAPLFEGETSRKVYLPRGNWYDFYTGEWVGNGNVVTVQGTLDKIPLFVRDGAVIPMIPPVLNTSQWAAGQPLELRVYGSAEGSFDLYDDDGTTYDFEQGNYSIRRFYVNGRNGKMAEVATGGTWTYGDVSWVFMGDYR